MRGPWMGPQKRSNHIVFGCVYFCAALCAALCVWPLCLALGCPNFVLRPVPRGSDQGHGPPDERSHVCHVRQEFGACPPRVGWGGAPDVAPRTLRSVRARWQCCNVARGSAHQNGKRAVLQYFCEPLCVGPSLYCDGRSEKSADLGYVAAVHERVSGGFRRGFPGVSGGFRGFPRVSGARTEWRARASCGNVYSFWQWTGGFLQPIKPLI